VNFLKRLKKLLLPFVLLTATLGFSQAVQGNGVQPGEAQNSEVSLDTLNIHLDIPLVNKKGIGLPTALSLSYNSNLWLGGTLTHPGAFRPSSAVTPGWNTPVIIGGSLQYEVFDCGVPVPPPGQGNYKGYKYTTYTDVSGAVHPFTEPGGVLSPAEGLCALSSTVVSVDGSGFTYNLTTPGLNTSTVVDPSGTVLHPIGITTDLSSSIVDVNGNAVSYSSSTGVLTDTFGVAEVTVTGTPASGTVTYTYPISTGTASVNVLYTGYRLGTYFQCGANAPDWSSDQTFYLPTKVNLPDGSNYAMTYESQVSGTVTGRLASIVYPNGAAVSYAYSGPNNGVNCGDGSTAGLTKIVSGDATYSFTRNTSTWLTTTEIDAVGIANNTAVYTFVQQPVVITFGSFFMTKEVENQGSSTPLVTKTYCYQGTSCPQASVAPSFPITQTDVYTTLAGMSTSSRVSKTFDAYQNVTKTALYDFGASTPTRQTVSGPFGYTWNGNTSSPTCTTAIGSGVNDVPCQVQLENGAGSQLRNAYFKYDTSSNPGSLLESAVLTGGSSYLISAYTYNTNGVPSTVTDAAGNITNFAYSSSVCKSGRPTSITVWPVAGTTSLVTSFLYDSGCKGAVTTKITDPNSKPVTLGYSDPFWRLTTYTDELGNTTNNAYPMQSPYTSIETTLNFSSSTVDVYQQSYPNLGKALAQQLESPTSSNWDTVLSAYTWNSTGIFNSSSLPVVGTKTTVPTNVVNTTVTHDALGRTLVTTDGGGGTVTTAYTGQDVLNTLGPAPAGEVVKQVQKEYDGLGQLLSTCEISNSSQPLASAKNCGQVNGGYTGYLTKYTYNAEGTLASVAKSSSAATQTHSYTYDKLGRVLTETLPESGTVTNTYDGTCTVPTSGCGQLVSSIDANGNTSSYVYDGLNRVTSITYSGPNADGYNQYFVYDKAVVDGTAMVNAKGRLAEAYTATTATASKYVDEGFGYTARGESSDVYELTPNLGGYKHTKTSYYANGVLNSISGIPGGPWTYSVDGKGRLSDSTNGSSTILTAGITYNAADQPLVVTYGSGDYDTYTYDPLTTRMTGYAFTIGSTPATDSGTLIWNANGTLRSLSIADGVNSGGSQTCAYGGATAPGYDSIGRLLSVSCGYGAPGSKTLTYLWGQSFSYDVFNNLTKTVPAAPSGSYVYTPTTWNPGYSSSTNRPNGTTSDANGNLLTDTFHTYTWNQNNKITGVTDAGISVKYDAFGNAVEYYNGTTYTQPILSPMGNLGLWSKTALSKYRVPLPGGSELVSGTDIWHRDWLGSVRLASSLTGRNSVKDTAFAPYGETYATFGSATDDINFTGDNQDLVAGIFDTPNRELNPDQGRWLSPDPSSSGWNAYAYSDNPLGEVDPTGLSILDWLFGSKNCSSSTGKSCRWNNAWNGDNLQYAGAGIWLAPGSGTVGINCGVITGCGHGLHQITIKWSETNGGAGDSWDRSFISESVGEFEWDLVREGIFLGAARGTPSGDGGLVNGSVAMARNWLKQPTKYGTVATDINGNHWIQLAIEDIEKGNQWALESQMVVDAWVNGNKNPGYYIVKLTSENYMNRLDALDAEYNLNKFGRGMLEAAHAFPTTPRLSMYGNMPKDLRPNMEDMFKYKIEGD